MVRSLLTFSAVLLIASPSFSDEPVTANDKPQDVVVSADRLSTIEIGERGYADQIITREEIEAKQYRQVYEALKDIPGVNTVATSPGQTASVFIRGEQSEETLILIDGIEFNDPTDPARSADLSVLQMDNIERIEVIRGAQSVLYPGTGSVINIITRSGRKHPGSEIALEGGSYGTARGLVSSRGVTSSGLDYAFSAGAFFTDGIPLSATATHPDAAKDFTFTGRLMKDLDENTSSQLVVRYIDSRADLDQIPQDTPDYWTTQQNLMARLYTEHRTRYWTPSLGINARWLDRESINEGSTPNMHFYSTGDNEQIDWMNDFPLLSRLHLLVGFITTREHADIRDNEGTGFVDLDTSIQQSTALSQIELRNETGFSGTAGVRIDYHPAFLWQPTFRIAPSYQINQTQTTFRASGGTGFKAPSLYELDGQYGNPHLGPEKSVSLDFGIEQWFFEKKMQWITTVFYNNLTDMADFNFQSYQYISVGKATTEGIEFSQSDILADWLKFTIAYTYLMAKDDTTGEELLRRPRNSFSSALTAQFEKWTATLSYSVVGLRTDIDPVSFARISMDAYELLAFAGDYQPWKQTHFTLRFENILNERYQPIAGYGAPRLSVYGGIRQEL